MASACTSCLKARYGILVAFASSMGMWILLRATGALCGQEPKGCSDKHATAAVTFLMASLWIAGTPHSAVVSVLPIVILPLLGVGGKPIDLANQYFNATNFVLFGSFLLATAIQEVGLHRRVALRLLSSISGDPKVVLLAFMMITAALSAFMSNTATAALMCPMAVSLFDELRYDGESPDQQQCDVEQSTEGSECRSVQDTSCNTDNLRKFFKRLLVGLPYACSIGGISTLTGTGTNLVFAQLYSELTGHTISYSSYLVVGSPICLVQLVLCWAWLCFANGGLGLPRGYRIPTASLKQRYLELGRVSSSEVVVGGLCLLTVVGWIFRAPGWCSGFASWFPNPAAIDDAVVVMTASLTLFFIPMRQASTNGQANCTILEWSKVEHKLPLGLFLLIGAGAVLSCAFQETGLSSSIGQALISGLGGMSLFPVALICSICAAALSQVTSDVAVANILLPIVHGLAQSLKVDPMALMLPTALSCSLPYMLIISTPANAIAFQTGFITQADLIKNGFPMVLQGLAILLAVCFSFGFQVLRTEDAVSWSSRWAA
mmetsp:Transcript_141416/g.368284  ORF Transcript_141416/g.368284 Transcript_141416/m.368284 type:complete len:547 (+) Transcript_141416:59-1699(+)